MGYAELQGFKKVKGFMTSRVILKSGNSLDYEKAVTITEVGSGDTVATLTLSDVGQAEFLTDNGGKFRATVQVGENDSYTKDFEVKNYGVYRISLRDTAIIYGFKIEKANTSPSGRVTAIEGCDNENMTPVQMNFSTGVFNYGDWENAFFMPRPCMLLYDGTVDYYLDPDNYNYREDGVTASDITSDAYGGNAMMEFPKVYLYTYEDANYEYHYISNVKVNDNYHCYSHLDQNGNEIPYCYMPIYNGSVVSSKLRSLSGKTIMKTQTATTEVTYATANGTFWNIESLNDRMLVNELLVLMGMSTDTQTVYGQGAHTSGTEAINNTFTTGIHNTKGLFYGTNSGTVASSSFGNCVKIFGMENYWGLQWRRILGWIVNNGTQKIKLTYSREDGSSVSGYNLTGEGYVTIDGITPSGTNGGYISAHKTIGYGRIPYQASGSSTYYECDGLYFANNIVSVPYVGGYSNGGGLVGAFCVALDNAASFSGWALGAAISCKPNLQES